MNDVGREGKTCREMFSTPLQNRSTIIGPSLAPSFVRPAMSKRKADDSPPAKQSARLPPTVLHSGPITRRQAALLNAALHDDSELPSSSSSPVQTLGDWIEKDHPSAEEGRSSPPLAYPETLPEDNEELDESEFASDQALDDMMAGIETARGEEWKAWVEEAIASGWEIWLKKLRM